MSATRATSGDASNASGSLDPSDVLLSIDGVEVTYERIEVAVRGVSVEVPRDQITVVLGANGAGKTSLLRAICGFTPGERAAITAGQIVFNGQRIDGWSLDRTSRAGLVLVPESDKIFPRLTVEENLRLSAVVSRSDGSSELMNLVYDTFPMLKARRRSMGAYLSGGERQMLAVGSALLLQPRVLLVDELSLGLAPNTTAELLALVGSVAAQYKLAILMVEQNAKAALAIADYGYVMEGGRIVLSGTARQLREHEDIRAVYLGIGSTETEAQSFAHVKQYARRRRWR